MPNSACPESERRRIACPFGATVAAAAARAAPTEVARAVVARKGPSIAAHRGSRLGSLRRPTLLVHPGFRCKHLDDYLMPADLFAGFTAWTQLPAFVRRPACLHRQWE